MAGPLKYSDRDVGSGELKLPESDLKYADRAPATEDPEEGAPGSGAPPVRGLNVAAQAALVDTPLTFVAMADLVRGGVEAIRRRGAQAEADVSIIYGPRQNPPERPPVEPWLDTARPALESAYEKYVGPYRSREDMSYGQRVGGDALVGGLAAAPFAIGGLLSGSGPLAAGITVGSGVTGGLAGSMAHEAELGPVPEFLASWFGSMIPSGVMRAPGIGPAARGAGGRMAGGFRARQAKREASGMLRRLLRPGDASFDDDLATAEARIRAEVGSADPGRATLAQTLGDEHPAGPSVLRAQDTLVKHPELGTGNLERRLARARQANERALGDAETALYPEAPETAGDVATSAMQAAKASEKEAVDAAYGEARRVAEAAPAVDVSGLSGRIREIGAQARPFLEKHMPKEADEALAHFESGRASLRDLDNLSKALNDVMGKAGSKDAQEFRLAAQMKGALEETLDTLEASGPEGQRAVAALRAARARHAEYQRLYGIKHPAVQSLLDRAEFGTGTAPKLSPKILTYLRRGARDAQGRPVEAARLAEALKDDPQAVEGVMRLAWQEILGGKPLIAEGGQTGASMQAALRQATDPATALVLRTIGGDQRYEASLRLLQRTRQLMFGNSGTQGAMMSTKSSIGADQSALGAIALDFLTGGKMSLAKSLLKPHSVGKAFYESTTFNQRMALFERALVDPETALHLLTNVKPAEIKRWSQRTEALAAAAESANAAMRMAPQSAARRSRD